MKAIFPIKGLSEVEVTNITKHGIWLLTKDHEIFVAFKEFPQFQDASDRIEKDPAFRSHQEAMKEAQLKGRVNKPAPPSVQI
jgi:hypothetical protein